MLQGDQGTIRRRRGALAALRGGSLAGILGLLATLFIAAPAQAAPTAKVTFTASPTAIRVGEAPYVSGTVTYNGRAAAGATVKIQYKLGSSWRDVMTRKTSSTGFFKANVYREKATSLRAYVLSSSKWGAGVSAGVPITITTEAQSFEQKVEAYKALLREPVSDARTGTSYSGNPVRWQRFQGGYVVEWGPGTSNARSWYVPAEFGKVYLDQANGVLGSLGRPTSDPECGLLDNGCIQRFEYGNIYRNATGTAYKTPIITRGTSVAMEMLAAAKTQVGYVEPAFRVNKYTTWSGYRVAWCAMFWSWSAAAVGQKEAVPQSRNYEEFKAAARARGFSSGPKVGQIVMLAFAGAANATHSGMVVGVNGNGTIRTLEGNVTQADGSRKVRYYDRPLSMVRGYYTPGT